MASHIKDIFNTFYQQSLMIADQVNKARYTGLGVQEETITDVLLNTIAYEHKENFVTRKFTKKEEGNYSGTDWLWCIGEPGAWVTFAIQAKIANINTGRINYLHYRNGEQYSALINFARQFRFIPKYTIYARISDNIDLFSRSVPELSNIPIEQWSFTSISPIYIKHLLSQNERHLSNVLQLAVPWTYAFSDNGVTNKSIATSVAGNFESVYWLLENEHRQRHGKNSVNAFKRVHWGNPQPLQLVSNSIPLPVLYLMTQDGFPHKVPISNVSVLSRFSVTETLDVELAKIEDTRKWKNFPAVFRRKVEELQRNQEIYMLSDGISE
ncbi:MAG TPA: hypothetical protein VFR47_27830 [Anaerolineales bacterium]|nr:hypothetical protein [Anaerolineales bacterium]